MKSFTNFSKLTVSLIALATLSACGAGGGGSLNNGNGLNTQPVGNTQYQNAAGNRTAIPPMDFRCGPNCIEFGQRWYNRGQAKSLQGKPFTIAILPANIQDCYQWRNYPREQIAYQRQKIKACYGGSCSTIVSGQNGGWISEESGEKIRSLPAGQYLVCATVDANKNGSIDEDEFFSQTRIQINYQQPYYNQGQYPVQQPYNPAYPQQPQQPYYNQGGYPQQPYGTSSSQPIPLNFAERYWDGSGPGYYY